MVVRIRLEAGSVQLHPGIILWQRLSPNLLVVTPSSPLPSNIAVVENEGEAGCLVGDVVEARLRGETRKGGTALSAATDKRVSWLPGKRKGGFGGVVTFQWRVGLAVWMDGGCCFQGWQWQERTRPPFFKNPSNSVFHSLLTREAS